MRLNRSLARIRLGHYSASLRDLNSVLSSDNLSTADKLKGLYRSAQAEYASGRYDAAKQYYEGCLGVDENLVDAKTGIQKCVDRLQEQQTGVYRWEELYDQTLRAKSVLSFDISDFVGPVKVAPVPNRGGGRGILATRDIEVGELLLVSKAIANGPPNNQEGILIALNFHAKEIQSGGHYTLIQNLMMKLMDSKQINNDFCQLYGGERHQPSNPDINDYFDENDPLSPPVFIDTNRVEAVCSLNWFGCSPENAANKTESKQEKPSPLNDGKSTVIYLLPSYFNHSCDANATRHFFGDAIVIRALTQIRAGDEITISYIYANEPYHERANTLKKWFPTCDCSLCVEDREAGVGTSKKRQKLLEDRTSTSLPTVRAMVSKMDATYPSTGPRVQPLRSAAHHRLSELLQVQGMRKQNSRAAYEAIKEEMASIEYMGIDVLDKGINDDAVKHEIPIASNRIPYNDTEAALKCLVIANTFCVLDKLDRAKQWTRAAVWISHKALGGGIHLFKAKFGDAIQEMGSNVVGLVEKIEKEVKNGIWHLDTKRGS